MSSVCLGFNNELLLGRSLDMQGLRKMSSKVKEAAKHEGKIFISKCFVWQHFELLLAISKCHAVGELFNLKKLTGI